MINQSHPEKEEREPLALAKTYPCDAAMRMRIVKEIENGLSIGELARGSNINRSIVSQYVAGDGNIYPGNIAPYERRMLAWIEKRNLEYLAGIETVETEIVKQVQALVNAVHRQRIIGRGIGSAGIGKTRAAMFIAAKDSRVRPYFTSKQSGGLETVRTWLFKEFGVRGGAKTYGRSNAEKYQELVKRVRDADVIFLFDQAHRLSISAMHLLCELWNDTKRAQLWEGTEALLDKIQRDAQIASRVEFGDRLMVDADSIHSLVQHQVKAVLPELNGEGARVVKMCEKLAVNGCFRRVEMRLGTMLYLSEKPSAKDKSWCELFEMAGDFSDANSQN